MLYRKSISRRRMTYEKFAREHEKSKLRKLEGIKYDELKENIKNVLKMIPKETYINIFKGSYERKEEYKKESNNRKISKNYKK